MRGKCLQHRKEKKEEKNILNIKKYTNHGFTMDNWYEVNWLLRSGLVLKINKDSKILRSNS